MRKKLIAFSTAISLLFGIPCVNSFDCDLTAVAANEKVKITTTTTAHTHNWVAVNKTVHHDEVGHWETKKYIIKANVWECFYVRVFDVTYEEKLDPVKDRQEYVDYLNLQNHPNDEIVDFMIKQFVDKYGHLYRGRYYDCPQGVDKKLWKKIISDNGKYPDAVPGGVVNSEDKLGSREYSDFFHQTTIIACFGY